MGVTETLARIVVETRYEDFPPGAIEHAKERLLDTFAVMVGGAEEKCTQIARQFVQDIGGNVTSRVVAQPWRTSAPNAALVNGVAAHALDYDETAEMAGHVTPCTFPPILAAADMVRTTGKEMLEAFIVSFELVARLAWGTNAVKSLHALGWHPIPLLGTFGATAAASRVLRLEVQQTRHALGMAGSLTGGIRKNIGTMTKPFHAGKAAQQGVMAAMMAQRGYTANQAILESVQDSIGHDHWSFPEAFCGHDGYDLEAMVKDLGKRWELDLPRTVTTKRYPGATARATPMDTTIDLVAKHNIRPEEIERIDVGVTTGAMATSSYRRPKDGLEARYSLWYDIAIAALDREGGLMQYTDQRARRPDVQAFMERVNVFIDPELDKKVKHLIASRDRGISHVTIYLKDGRKLYGERQYAKGYPQDPLVWKDIVEKYLACAHYARLEEKSVDPRPLIGMVEDIESLKDASDLMASLTPRR